MKKNYFLWSLLGLLMLHVGWAQQKTITGTVNDEEGLPLPGATIVVDGTTRGVATDFDGNFSIQANEGETLLITYIGYANTQITISSQDTYVVNMVLDSALDEVIVMGYGNLNKSELTGSAAQVKTEEIENFPVSSVDQILQGKVAGLSLNGTSGTPGSINNILIRGRSSITASNSPLYVIDGVPVISGGLQQTTAASTFSPLANLNPENIASISVLKDASSTAPYGARGTNGVIVITTKKGKAGETKINFTANYGFSNDATDGPGVLTAAEREMLYYEGLYNTFGESEGFTLSEAKQFYEDNTRFGTNYTRWNNEGRNETDWADEITNENAPFQRYNLSVTSGTEKLNYFTSFGYQNQKATVIGAKFERISGALSVNSKISEAISFNSVNNTNYAEQKGILEQSAYFSGPRTAKYFLAPLASPYNEDGSLNIDDLYSNVQNPLFIADNDLDLFKSLRITSNNTLKINLPLEGFSFQTRIAVDYNLSNYKSYNNRTTGDSDDVGGSVFVATTNNTNYVFQNLLKYDFNIETHKFSVSAVQEFQKNRLSILNGSGEGFSADGLTNLNSAGSNQAADSRYLDWSVGAYLGLLNYSFDNKYLVNASFRREANSRFPADSRWGDFWSLGFGWNIHNENFMGNIDFINSLKLRTSYGVTGNAGIGLNTYQASLGFSADYNDESAIFPAAFGNDLLQWESAASFEIGTDFSLFDNKLTGAFNYYRRETYDMLQNVPLSRTTGFDSQSQNIGRMENKGIEIELSSSLVNQEKFKLSFGGTLSTNKNEVLELAKDGNGEEINITTGTRRVEAGHTVYEWYMVSYAGVDPANGEALYYTDDTQTETTNNFNDAERVFQGKGAIPTLLLGGNIHVEYDRFYLDANINYTGGHQVWEPWTRYTSESDRWSTDLFQGLDILLDRWQNPGDITDVPKITHELKPWRTYSRHLHDGDYLRLRNLVFGYNINPSLLKGLNISSAQVFVRGTNLYTWVKDKSLNWDPEVDFEGFASLTTPPVKTIIFGLNLNL